MKEYIEEGASAWQIQLPHFKEMVTILTYKLLP